MLLEIEIMMKLRNNLNVVHFEDAYEDSRAVYLVMECVSLPATLYSLPPANSFASFCERRYFHKRVPTDASK